jgi:hypothetical protein
MKIFISSVTNQFKGFREEIYFHFQKMKMHEPFIQEEFTQSEVTLLEKLEQNVNQADYVILIIGEAYGYEAPPEIYAKKLPKRSYSQWEYYFSIGERLDGCTKTGKNIYVYFASEEFLKEHHVEQSNEARQLQEKFKIEIEASNKDYNPFNDIKDLLVKIDEDIFKVFRKITVDEYISPFAELYKTFKDSKNFIQHEILLRKIISFVVLLWNCDLQQKQSLQVNNSLDLSTTIQCFDFLNSLFAKSKNGLETNSLSYKLHLWFEEHITELEKIISLIKKACDGHDYDNSLVYETLDKIYLALDSVFNGYLLISIENNTKDNIGEIEIYKGLKTIRTKIELCVHTFGFYLISTLQRQVICLNGSIFKIAGDKDGLLRGWQRITTNNTLILQPFFKEESSAETNNSLELSNFNYKITAGLFTDDSWAILKKIAFPKNSFPELDEMGLLSCDDPIHKGKYGIIHYASSANGIRDHRLYLLSNEEQKDRIIKERFIKRAELWQLLQHDKIVPLSNKQNKTKSTTPCFAIKECEAKNLEEFSINNKIENKLLRDCINTAISITRVAHENNVCILTYPFRHFLSNAERLLMTGFDTIWELNKPLPSAREMMKLFKDYYMLPPEIKNGNTAPGFYSDIYSLGVFFKELVAHSDLNPCEELYSRIMMVVEHCVSKETALEKTLDYRFQTIDQLQYFINRIYNTIHKNSFTTPHLISLACEHEDSTKGKKLFISKFPIMNFEFLEYQKKTKYKTERDKLPARLKGPFLPVTHINKLEADAYCSWLTDKTKSDGLFWRLPNENEWEVASQSSNRKRDTSITYYSGTMVPGINSENIIDEKKAEMNSGIWEWCLNRGREPNSFIMKSVFFDSLRSAEGTNCRKEESFYLRSPEVGFRVVCEMNNSK